jgi:lipoprotein-releasing system permease protein
MAMVAGRWLKAAWSKGRFASSLLSSAGIAVGVATLIVVIGVMNGFQLGFIEAILAVDSHHARISLPAGLVSQEEQRTFSDELMKLPGVISVLPFIDVDTMIFNSGKRVQPVRLKAIPPDAELRDPVFFKKLGFRSGEFVGSPDGIVIGAELSRSLGVMTGDTVSVLAVSSSAENGLQAQKVPLVVSGLFRSGYYEFDTSLALISFETAKLVSGDQKPILGVKFGNLYDSMDSLDIFCKKKTAQLALWPEYNRSFFGALKTEKSTMLLLVGLIFVVVGLNIYHAMKRSVFERMSEIAVLKSLGAQSGEIRTIFVMDGFIIGLLGAFIGLAAGLILASDINGIIKWAESLVNAVGFFFKNLFINPESPRLVNLYSTSTFYMVEIPMRLYFSELAFIFSAGALSAAVAAFLASSRVLRYKPAEVLRDE